MKYLLFAIFALFGQLASAQSLVIATGAAPDEKGAHRSVYTQMVTELAAACPDPKLEIQNTTGSIQNIDLLAQNKVNLIIAQSDLLFARRESDPNSVAPLKTLAGLHPEDLLFAARADSYKIGGIGFGKYKYGGETIVYNTVDNLAGRQVGAVGGSVFSARTVSQYSGLNFTVREYPGNDELKKGLLDGEVDSILVVGGSPHPIIAGLSRDFKLLPVTPIVAERLKSIYTPSVATYSNIGANGVPTIATQALLLTRDYSSTSMKARLATLRTCFYDKLGDIKDTLNTHAAWQKVEASKPGLWQQYGK